MIGMASSSSDCSSCYGLLFLYIIHVPLHKMQVRFLGVFLLGIDISCVKGQTASAKLFRRCFCNKLVRRNELRAVVVRFYGIKFTDDCCCVPQLLYNQLHT